MHDRTEYFDDPDRRSIRPVDTPYVRRHLCELLAEADPAGARRVLEVGAGSGRFTKLLLAANVPVWPNEVSPALADALRPLLASTGRRVLAAPVEQLPAIIARPFDRAVGFFVLHHVSDLDVAFAALGRVLDPGSRVAFCEPNAYNPLFYLQVVATPSMSFRGEPSLHRMTPRRVLGAMRRQGFTDTRVRRYGFFPPLLANRRWGRRIETGLERLPLLEPLRAFQVFSGLSPSPPDAAR